MEQFSLGIYPYAIIVITDITAMRRYNARNYIFKNKLTTVSA